MSITRLGNTTSAVRARRVAARCEKLLEGEAARMLREYADLIEEDSDENHVCMFNVNSNHVCDVCGKPVTLSAGDLGKVLLLTDRLKVK